MGTQTEIVRLISQKKADYVLGLKSNHPTIYNQLKEWFNTAITQEFMGIEMSYDSRTEQDIIAPKPEKSGRYQLRL